MATNHGHGNGAERNLNVEYDKSDLSAKGILIFLVVLGVFALVINLAVIGLYAGNDPGRRQARDRNQSAGVADD